MDVKDIDKMRAVISSTDNIGPQLATTLKTFRKNLTAVLNSLRFDYSNGCLEGTNRKFKEQLMDITISKTC